MTKTNTNGNESAVYAAFKVLQFAKANKREKEFQFDVAESELRAADRQLEEAKEAFAAVTNELFEKTQAGQVIGEAA